MIISTVITRNDWLLVIHAWNVASGRLGIKVFWDVIQISDEGGIRKFTLKVNVHGEHLVQELMVELRISNLTTEDVIGPLERTRTQSTHVSWNASRRDIELPSCKVKCIEECNSRSDAVERFTPDEPHGIGCTA